MGKIFRPKIIQNLSNKNNPRQRRGVDSTTVFDPEYINSHCTWHRPRRRLIITRRLTILAIGLGYAFAFPLIPFTLTALPARRLVQRVSAGRDYTSPKLLYSYQIKK